MSYQWADWSSTQKINMETQLNTLNQMGLTNIYRAFHPKAKEYTLFRISHMPGYKTNLSKFNKVELSIRCLF